ncbi:MAG: ABC transporter transmembrane domain-containing protein [Bacilli bacterium]
MSAKAIVSEAISIKKGPLIFLGITILIATAFKISMAFILQIIIDQVLPLDPTLDPALGMWVGLFVVAMIFSVVLDFLSNFQAVNIGTFVTESLSKEVFSHAIRADYLEISQIPTSDLAVSTTKDCEVIGNQFIGKNWVQFWKQIIVLTALFATMMAIVPLWGLITFIVLPFFYMVMHSLKKFINKIDADTFEKIQNLQQNTQNTFSQIRGIKLKNGIIPTEEQFGKDISKIMRKHRFLDMLKRLYDSQLGDLFVGSVIAVILGIGGYLTIRGDMEATIGKLLAFIAMIPFVYHSFKSLMNISIHSKIVEKELKSLDFILSLHTEMKSEPINQLEEVLSLKFQRVSYYNEAKDNTIDQVSFELKRNEKLGVLSYEPENRQILFELLTKLIKPKDGIISINNCDINKMNTQYLRETITSISADQYLNEDTIANNITFPLAFDEYKYNDALNRSGLKEIIAELELKDQTVIAKSASFSKAFLQRLQLANAFYKDSKIFVLNDATSYLDIRSEEAIMKEVNKLKNKMVIIMSDKVYNVLNCDKIIILMNGQVVEYGKLPDLLQNKDSEFNKMIKKVKTTKAIKVS